MSEQEVLCKHCNEQNICKSVAGKKVHRDQCVKCYDDPVSIKSLIIY